MLQDLLLLDGTQVHTTTLVYKSIGRISQHSRQIVWEEYKRMGLELAYECDAYNDDLPYWIDMKSNESAAAKEEGLLVIPYTLDQNDMKFCVVISSRAFHLLMYN